MNYRGGLNLRALKNVELMVVTLPNGKSVRAWVVPTYVNDMEYKKEDGTIGCSPFINFQLRECNGNFIKSYREKHSGEKNYRDPSHTINSSYSKDFTALAEAAAAKRIERERSEKGEAPLTTEQLAEKAKYAVRQTFGVISPFDATPDYQPQGNATAQAVDTNEMFSGEAPVDDLPF